MNTKQYILTNTIDRITYYFCKDRKFRQHPTIGDYKECLATYCRPGNATKNGNTFVRRGIIKDFEVKEYAGIIPIVMDFSRILSQTLR